MEPKKILIAFIFFYCFWVFRNPKEKSKGIDSCRSGLHLKSEILFDTTSFRCLSVWDKQGYILRYMRTDTNIWSFVLSAPNSDAYIAMGFSKNGKMVGSNAIVGWVSDDGAATMKTYFLGGQSPDEVLPDEGNLQLVNFTSSVIAKNSRIYMAFQLNTEMPDNQLIYSVGPTGILPFTDDYELTEHSDHISTSLRYNTGIRRPYANLRRIHGLLCMFGFGIFMPIGAVIARYFRQYPPEWFYWHLMFQSLGLILGYKGVEEYGLPLSKHLQKNVPRHESLGNYVLILTCFQYFSLLAYPNQTPRIKRYRKLCHYTIGSVLLILGPINTFYGIYLGNAGFSWYAGYALFLVILLIIVAELEIELRCGRRNR